MTELIGGIDYAKIRTNDDALQSIALEHRLGKRLNDFFVGKVRGLTLPYTTADVDLYWTPVGIRIPPNAAFIDIRSRKVFEYAALYAESKLPPMQPNVNFSMGLGNGGAGPFSYVLLNIAPTAINMMSYSVTELEVIFKRLEITNIMPADYTTLRHAYHLKANRFNFELWINGVLRGVILFPIPEPIPDWVNTYPYVLGSIPGQALGSTYTSIVEIIAEYIGFTGTFPLETVSSFFNVADGPAVPPRQYALYTENTATKWNGLATSAVVTSHPVPVWGYSRKTLLFQANAAGTLAIQVYAGGAWREWASITLIANQLEVYNLNGEVPIARCVYTPVGTDTIAVAEWMLAGD